jgi:hypothetical protein
MTEELKIVVELLSKVSEDTVTGVIAYMTFVYLKPVTMTTIICVTVCKVIGKAFVNDTVKKE